MIFIGRSPLITLVVLLTFLGSFVFLDGLALVAYRSEPARASKVACELLPFTQPGRLFVPNQVLEDVIDQCNGAAQQNAILIISLMTKITLSVLVAFGLLIFLIANGDSWPTMRRQVEEYLRVRPRKGERLRYALINLSLIAVLLFGLTSYWLIRPGTIAVAHFSIGLLRRIVVEDLACIFLSGLVPSVVLKLVAIVLAPKRDTQPRVS